MRTGSFDVRLSHLSFAPLGLALCGLVAACDSTPGETDRAFSADGRIIAMSGGAGGAANACFTCHGLDGGGDGLAAPRLAGMDAGYLQKQMEDYASGLRPDDAMTRIAKALDQKGRREVAAYYAALPAPATAPASNAPAPALYLNGDPARGVVACASCHGADGQGTGRGGNPQIVGQPFAYTLEQIERWKSGDRRNDPRGVMAAAVKPLSDAEARAIATWLSSRPSAPAPASAAASGSASVAAAARPAASRETRRPDRSDGA
jgi:cytochrome c553